MKLRFSKKLNIILAIALSFAITMTYVPQSVYAVDYAHNIDRSEIPANGTGPNDWQIIDRVFPGLYSPQGMDVSAGFDTLANVTYTQDDNVRMSNTIIATGTENEFKMYTCIEPRVSWQDIMALNTIIVSNNNKPISAPDYPSGGGFSYLKPEKGGNYTTAVYLEYYAMVNGQRVVLAKTTMYGAQNPVDNCGAGVGNFLFGEGSFFASNGMKFKSATSASNPIKIDITKLYNEYDFAIEPVYSKTVVEEKKPYIQVYPNSFNYDGDSCSISGDTITWKLPTEDLGLLPHTTDSSGHTKIYGVMRRLDNGKITYYRQEAFQRIYDFSLDVTAPGFQPGEPVQVTESPQDSSKAGSIFYNVGESGPRLEGFLNPNSVMGYLYDLEFDKVIKDTDAKLEGAKFKLTRIKGDGSGTYSDTRTYTTADMISKEDGSVKFRNMPWGYYKLEEIDINNMHAVFDSDVDKDYFPDSNLGTVPAKDTYGNNGLAAVGWVIRNNNADGYITADHTKMHLADLDSDVNKMLYTFTPDKWNKRKGKVENEPYWTIIQPEKEVLKYDDLTAKLKNESFKITTKDYTEEGDSDKVFLYGDDFTKISLPIFNKESNLQHAENDSFRIMLPKNGAYIDVSETLTDKQKKHFEYVETIAKAVKGSVGDVTEFESRDGAKVKVLAGTTANPVTTKLIVKNRPFTLVKLKKAIDNYKSQLADDEFIISLTDTKGLIDTQAVLKHNGESGIIKIYDATTLKVDETMPMEYSFGTTPVTAKVNDENKTVTNKKLATELGEVVELTVHNKYDWQPYFHDFDTVTNDFRP